MATPIDITHLDEVPSTQDEARERLVDRPVLVTARSQTAGRGRSGARWIDADRALAASLALRPSWPPETWGRIPLVAGLAALDVLPGALRLKWPNDVVAGEAKVAGILVEADDETAVVGMGVNLWWAEPPEGMGSVWGEDPGAETGPETAASWAAALLRRLEPGPDRWGRDEYRERCMILGRRIAWEPSGAGTAATVDDDGRLVVETASGPVALDSGAVRVVRSG